MDLIRTINKNLASLEEEDELRKMAERAAEIEAQLPRNRFSLDSYMKVGGEEEQETVTEGLLGGVSKEKKRQLERAAKYKGRSTRVQRNAADDWTGGADNTGRLAKLNKVFDVAKMVNGKPPEIPNGMTLQDYEIWIASLKGKTREAGATQFGPKKSDVVVRGGKEMVIVTPNKLIDGRVYAIAQDAEGNKVKIDWEELPKPQTSGDKSIYRMS